MFIPATIDITDVKRVVPAISNEQRDNISGGKKWYYKRMLDKVTDKNGIINGSELRDNIFPIEKDECFDVFISYSHNDEETAYALYKYLKDKGLHVFLDSIVWYSADKLQYEIDKQYSKTNRFDPFFDYDKVQLSASHVHAMLSMAILEVINRSELCLFLKSNKSLTLEEGIKNNTLSPWIYEELSYFKKVKTVTPPRLKQYQTRYFCSTGNRIGMIVEQRELKVHYNVDIRGLVQLCVCDLLKKSSGSEFLDDIYLKHGILEYSLND